MKSFSLVYSNSCPNYKAAKKLLEELGLAFEEINQDKMHEGCCGKNLTSPTLLADDDIIIFGGETTTGKRACSEALPDKTELRILLNGLT